jgi:hypothetical protein
MVRFILLEIEFFFFFWDRDVLFCIKYFTKICFYFLFIFINLFLVKYLTRRVININYFIVNLHISSFIKNISHLVKFYKIFYEK